MSAGERTTPGTVGVIGLGLIGGSVARAWLRRGGSVVGYARRPEVRRSADRAGVRMADTIADVVATADLVVLATSLSALPAVLDTVSVAIAERTDPPTVTDVGSVKAALAHRATRVLPDPSVFVPGHPMAGTEHQGWDASSPDLFEGATWALGVEEPVDMGRLVEVARLVIGLGARVVPVAAGDHDEAVALTSHLPHVLAAELADRVADVPLARSLVGGSFRDATRVVRGGSRLGEEMVWANRGEVAEALDGLVAGLAGLRDALRRDDEGAVRALFQAAEDLTDQPRTTEELPVARQVLLDLGRAGGVVVGIAERDGEPVVLASRPVDGAGR